MVDFNSESNLDFEALTPDEILLYSLMSVPVAYMLVPRIGKLLIANSSSHQDFNTENDGDCSPS